MSFVPTRVPAPPRHPGTVAVTVDGVTRRGRSVDLRGRELSPETLTKAVREASTAGPSRSPPPALHVDCEPAGPVHASVCRIPPTSFDLHDALVAAARSRGVVPPSVRRLERARADLAAVSYDRSDVDHASAKRRIADAGARERRLGERVAALRGRLGALREVGADTTGVEAELAAAVAALTESETERIAAEQRLSQVERDARSARTHRQHRLRLADRVANLRRQVRRQLVEWVADDFAAALTALPGGPADGCVPATYEGDSTTAALAVAHLARVDSPIVLSVERFGSPAEAATRLNAPVVQV